MKQILITKEKILSKFLEAIKIFLFSLLISIGANLKIILPFSPVPVTFQTFFLFMSVIYLGKKAVQSVSLYLGLGFLGVPLFAFGGGPLYVFSPTFGYLMGFLVCSLILGYVFDKKTNNIFLDFIWLIIGNFIIYFFGVNWLIIGFGFTFEKALDIGMLPFLVGDLMKISPLLFLKKLVKK